MLPMSKSQHEINKIEVAYVLVNFVGFVFSYDVISAIRPVKTVLVTRMLVKNNSGVL